ncbi:cytochrome c oxidase subunit II [Coraliomargarita parva]|uniref:cytochrome c oxidase subunit II n=1 Tax=Coraliomargarita parva TaxID=3014050 RepID=UPI0022B2E17A|nr:cytochrome c oxidase subunit II [Coraliomargarita parva]
MIKRLSGARFLWPIYLLPALLLLGGCNLHTRMSTFDAKGPIAEEQLNLFMITVWVTCFIFVVVGGVFLYSVVKFREKPGDTRPLPKQGHGNPLVEIGLIGASVLLLVIIAVPTLKAIWFTHETPDDKEHKLGSWYSGSELSDESEDEILTIRVIGYQWWWEFEYPQLGITTANEMVIPAGKAVHLELRSVDVIHSFWLPRIAGKVDLIPGRANSMWIQAGDSFEQWLAKSGTPVDEAPLESAYSDYLQNEIYDYYYGQCAEYCGDSHARMLFRSTVVSNEDFHQWVNSMQAGQQAPDGKEWDEWLKTYNKTPDQLTGDLNEGLKLFVGKGTCSGCHTINGHPLARGVAGPDLTKLASRYSIAAGWLNHRNEDGSIDREQQYANFVKWLSETNKVKPGNLMWDNRQGGGIGHMGLTEDENRKIATYLQSLK